jgi:hypothetical protein
LMGARNAREVPPVSDTKLLEMKSAGCSGYGKNLDIIFSALTQS